MLQHNFWESVYKILDTLAIDATLACSFITTLK